MDPKQWGPETWTYLHVLSLKSHASYDTLKNFFYHLHYLLPCSLCRNNYQEHLKQIPFPGTKKEIASWLIRLHNRVNQTREKEETMLIYWNHRIKQMKYSYDIGVWTFLQCAIHTHPGKRHISDETIQAHRFIWEHMDELLPKFLEDSAVIYEYVKRHPIKDYALKTKYHQQAHEFFNHFHLIKHSIKEHQLCKKT
jgi:hypothetical protein